MGANGHLPSTPQTYGRIFGARRRALRLLADNLVGIGMSQHHEELDSDLRSLGSFGPGARGEHDGYCFVLACRGGLPGQ